MKYLKKFSLFEKAIIKVDYTPNKELVSMIKAMPGYKDLVAVSDDNNRPVWKSPFDVDISGGAIIFGGGVIEYNLRITSKKSVYYGGLEIISNYIVLDDWTKIIDYLTVYSCSKLLSINSDALEKFVFGGQFPSPSSFLTIKESPKVYDVLSRMAVRYIGSEKTAEIVKTLEDKLGASILDKQAIVDSDAYKFFSKIPGIKVKQEDYGPRAIVLTYDILMGMLECNEDLFGFDSDNVGEKIPLGLGPESGNINVKSVGKLSKEISKRIAEKIDRDFSWLKRRSDTTPLGKSIIGLSESIFIYLIDSYNNGKVIENIKKSPEIISIVEKYLDMMRKSNPIGFTKIIGILLKSKWPSLVELATNYKKQNPALISGANLLKRFDQ